MKLYSTNSKIITRFKIVLLLALSNHWFAQPMLAQASISNPTTIKVWDKTLGGDRSEGITSQIATSDGGYLLAGTSSSGAGGDKTEASRGSNDYWVVKINANGSKLWDKSFGGSDDDMLHAVIQTPDGGYLLGGTSSSVIGGDKTEASRGSNDYWVVKINANGSKLWDKTYGGSGNDELRSLVQSPDGGYLLAGTSSSGAGGDKTEASRGSNDYWVVKINANGSKLWDKSFGGSDGDFLRSAINTADGGYLLGGGSVSGISNDKSEAAKSINEADYWVVKINSNGSKVWDRTIGGSLWDEIRSLATTTDGGYLLGGISSSGINGDKTETNMGHYDYWVVKINSEGNKVWDKTLAGNNFDDLYSVATSPDGGFFLGGRSISPISGDKTEPNRGQMDYWVVKINANGNKVWDKTLGGSGWDDLRSILVNTDGSFLLGGYSDSAAGGDKTEASKGLQDFWVIKLAETSPASPTVTGTVRCGSGSVTLSAAGAPAGGFYRWYTTATGGTAIANATSAAYTTPTLSATTIYYVSIVNSFGQESARTSVTATISAIPAAPGVTATYSYCQGSTATALTATGSNLKWYTVSSGGTASTAAPTPATTTAGTTKYYVSQTVNGCESPRAEIAVTVNYPPSPPHVTISGIICGFGTVTLTANGGGAGNYHWYILSSGMPTLLATGATYIYTTNYRRDNHTFFASVVNASGCESALTAATVQVYSVPSAPVVTSTLTYCQGATATPLTAIGSNLKWYTSGGTLLTKAPTPSTTSIGSTDYYVSQVNFVRV